MVLRLLPLERSFQIAKSDRVSRVEEIRTTLVWEGFENSQISGPRLLKQLRELMRTALQAPNARDHSQGVTVSLLVALQRRPDPIIWQDDCLSDSWLF
jgi:hypothetical protein